ncbi:hypothetical protein QQ008_30055 [Fulvivirgaceae bacterium BMA10]|uniref:Haloacid dehalogenase-like hydrolase n=1 Tax=Splendidivirga corallicola TaxID=3051826 RepID=A0ABT8KXW2_9BACT|nr:hypothetical protein [Fulvivirgaceae bacterium BMA10]
MYVFDICDTLYFSNTTFDFIPFVLEREKAFLRKVLFKIYTIRFSPIFLSFYFLNKITSIDHCRKYSLLLLSGISKDDLYSYGREFHSQYLKNKEVKETHLKLKEAIKTGEIVILLSSSIDPIVDAISQDFNVQYQSSSLVYENDICTGKLAYDLTNKKHIEVTKFQAGEELITVVTDNFSDQELMKLAETRYAVIYKKSAKQFWDPLKPYYIDLS